MGKIVKSRKGKLNFVTPTLNKLMLKQMEKFLTGWVDISQLLQIVTCTFARLYDWMPIFRIRNNWRKLCFILLLIHHDLSEMIRLSLLHLKVLKLIFQPIILTHWSLWGFFGQLKLKEPRSTVNFEAHCCESWALSNAFKTIYKYSSSLNIIHTLRTTQAASCRWLCMWAQFFLPPWQFSQREGRRGWWGGERGEEARWGRGGRGVVEGMGGGEVAVDTAVWGCQLTSAEKFIFRPQNFRETFETTIAQLGNYQDHKIIRLLGAYIFQPQVFNFW